MRKLFTIRKSVATACIGVALILSTSVSGDASKVHSLKVEKTSGASSFVIAKMGAVEVQDFMMVDPPRLVLDLIGAQHDMTQNKFDGDGDFVSKVRTSQFTNEPDQITRIVFDLNKDVSYQVSSGDQSVTVSFFSKNGSMSKPRVMAGSTTGAMPMPEVNTPSVTPAPKTTPSTVNSAPSNMSTPKPAAKSAWTPSPSQSTPVQSKPAPQTSAMANDKPQTAWAAQRPSDVQKSASPSTMGSGTQKFQSYAASSSLVRNKNITLDVQNADIKTVLRSMSEFSNTNIISGPEVEGKVTAHLKQVPWRQALDIVLKSHGFGWREEYGVIRVSTMEKLTKEELELQEADRRKDTLLPLVTRIIPLSFSNGGEMKQALVDVLTERGSIQIEQGSNAMIVTDIEHSLDKIELMIEELDRKIKQVEIVAKMVDVDYEASQEMGIRWDALSLNVDNVNGAADAVINARSSTPVGTFRVGTVQSFGQIQALVDVMAKENKANIISNPRIVTADNREASILVGKEIPLIVSDEAGNPITELTKVGIILRVTPHINKDNTITLDLHPEVSELSAQATVQGGVVISLSEADTRLVIGNGETAVMGGLINEVESKLENGVPILKDLPIIGSLFKLKSTTTKKRELIIFVTPRIVDSAIASTE